MLQAIAYRVVSSYRAVGMVDLYIVWKLPAVFHEIRRNILVDPDPPGRQNECFGETCCQTHSVTIRRVCLTARN